MIPSDALIAFLDTETNGMMSPKKDLHDRLQCHTAQIALLVTKLDGTEVARFQSIIRPDFYDMPDFIAQIHGITQARAMLEGKPRAEVFAEVQKLLSQCWIMVCHNYDFDSRVLQAEHDRNFGFEFPPLRALCTMKHMTPICGLTKANGTPKWPKLMEAYVHCFQKEFEGAHDAMFDTLACRDIFQWLRANNKLPAFA